MNDIIVFVGENYTKLTGFSVPWKQVFMFSLLSIIIITFAGDTRFFSFASPTCQHGELYQDCIEFGNLSEEECLEIFPLDDCEEDDLLNLGISVSETGTGDVESGTGDIETGTGDVESGTGDVETGTGDIETGTGDIETGTGDVESGTGDIETGTGDVESGTGDVESGTGDIETGTGDVETGTGDIETGTGSLIEEIGQESSLQQNAGETVTNAITAKSDVRESVISGDISQKAAERIGDIDEKLKDAGKNKAFEASLGHLKQRLSYHADLPDGGALVDEYDLDSSIDILGGEGSKDLNDTLFSDIKSDIIQVSESNIRVFDEDGEGLEMIVKKQTKIMNDSEQGFVGGDITLKKMSCEGQGVIGECFDYGFEESTIFSEPVKMTIKTAYTPGTTVAVRLKHKDAWELGQISLKEGSSCDDTGNISDTSSTVKVNDLGDVTFYTCKASGGNTSTCGDSVWDPDGADNDIGGGDDEECDGTSDCSASCECENGTVQDPNGLCVNDCGSSVPSLFDSCIQAEDLCDINDDGNCDGIDTYIIQDHVLNLDTSVCWESGDVYPDGHNDAYITEQICDVDASNSVSTIDISNINKILNGIRCPCLNIPDTDGDGHIGGDCEPNDATIHPGATEICDGVDNNCDGYIDENDVCLDSYKCGGTGGDDNDGKRHRDNADCGGSDLTYNSAEEYPNGVKVCADSNTSPNDDTCNSLLLCADSGGYQRLDDSVPTNERDVCDNLTPGGFYDSNIDYGEPDNVCIDENDSYSNSNCLAPTPYDVYTCNASGGWDIAVSTCSTVDSITVQTVGGTLCVDPAGTIPGDDYCLVCGDGEVDQTETCDESDTGDNGCTGTDVCNAGCTACVDNTPPSCASVSGTYTSQPYTDDAGCDVGTYADIVNTTDEWYRECTNAGTTIQCEADKQGVCDSVGILDTNVGYTNQPAFTSAEGCDVDSEGGTMGAFSEDPPADTTYKWVWECDTGNANDATCEAYKNPLCKDWPGVYSTQQATDDASACDLGAYVDIADNETYFFWECEIPGTNILTVCSHAKTSACTVYPGEHETQPADGTGVPGDPDYGCESGTYADISDTGTHRQWECDTGGSTLTCDALKDLTPYDTYTCNASGGRDVSAGDCGTVDSITVQSQGGTLCVDPAGTIPGDDYCLVCGDGEVDQTEVCDESDAGGNGCTGTDVCNATCTECTDLPCNQDPLFGTACGGGVGVCAYTGTYICTSGVLSCEYEATVDSWVDFANAFSLGSLSADDTQVTMEGVCEFENNVGYTSTGDSTQGIWEGFIEVRISGLVAGDKLIDIDMNKTSGGKITANTSTCVLGTDEPAFASCIQTRLEQYLTQDGATNGTNYDLEVTMSGGQLIISFLIKHYPSVTWYGFDQDDASFDYTFLKGGSTYTDDKLFVGVEGIDITMECSGTDACSNNYEEHKEYTGSPIDQVQSNYDEIVLDSIDGASFQMVSDIDATGCVESFGTAGGTADPDDSVCDGLDNDCDGSVDEDYTNTSTSCGVGECSATGTLSCVSGAESDSCSPGTPAADDSVCDGLDNDCDGSVDEDYTNTSTSCGVGECSATGTLSCVSGAESDSCSPGTPAADDSVCDGLDNDCDAQIDEDYVETSTSCGVGPCSATGTLSCVSGAESDSCTAGTPGTEICDGIDNDCSGVNDDNLPIPTLECEALIAVYTGTDGDNWTTNTGWMTDPVIDDWWGIEVSGGHVTRLCLADENNDGTGTHTNCGYAGAGNNLVGTITPKIGDLVELERLSFAKNSLTGGIPTTVGNLVDVTTFYMNDNDLTVQLPDEIRDMSSLTHLYGFRNDFGGVLPAERGNGLDAISYIHFSNNLLGGNIPTSWSGLADTIDNLVLYTNSIGGSIPDWVGNVDWATHLQLYNNNLSGPLPSTFGNTGGPVNLYLYSNDLTGPLPANIGNMTDVKLFYLQNNDIDGSIPDSLGSLVNATHVYLQDNDLTGSVPDTVDGLDKVTHFYLYNNELSGQLPTELGSLDTLKVAYWYSNEFTGIIPESFTNLSAVTNFRVQNNNLDREGTAYPKKADVSSTVQTRGDGLTYFYIGNQGDVTAPVLSNGDSIPAVVTGAFSYNFDIDENSFAIDSSGNEMPISIGSGGNCLSLTTTDEVDIINGTMTITLTPNTYGMYTGCLLEVTDHGDELGNSHNTANVGTMMLDTFCHGQTYYFDGDGDGYGDGTSQLACADPGADWYLAGELTETSTDCDDAEASAYPGGDDTVCDGIDNDCDTQTDEDYTTTSTSCGVGECSATGTLSCVAGAESDSCTPGTSGTEICDGLDNDCTGVIDDNLPIPTLECEALIAVYTGTDGDNWTTNTGWMTDPVIDDWWGIEVSGGNVTRLCLADENSDGTSKFTNCGYAGAGNNLVGTITDKIGDLVELERLSFAKNSLTGGIPTTVGNLVDVTHFHFNHNTLTAQLPDEIRDMTSLQNLFGAANGITGTLPAVRGDGLGAISYIHLSSNSLTGPIPTNRSSFSNKIDNLILSVNDLSGTIPDWIGDTEWGTYLYLHQNDLSGPIPSTFGNTGGPVNLYMYSNDLTGPLPTNIGNMTDVVHFWLYNNDIDGAIPDSIGSLVNAKYIYLQDNELTGSIPTTVDGLDSVERFYVNGNDLEGELPTEIGTLDTLKVVYMYNNEFIGAIPDSFANLNNVTNFRVQNNNLDRENSTNNYAVNSSSVQTWGDGLTYFLTSNQGDITAPVLSNGDAIPAVVSGAFSYDFDIDENSFAIDAASNEMSISVGSGGNCPSLTTTDTVDINNGTVSITFTPSTYGMYTGCLLEVTDHGDELGNSHNTANIGDMMLDTFCYGQTYYLDGDGDGYGDGTSQLACTDPGADWYLAGELTETSTDCDDAESAANPGATEICDSIDNDCDTEIDEGDVCYDCPGIPANYGDSCDDSDPDTFDDEIQTDCSCAGLTWCGNGVVESPNTTGIGGPNNDGIEACDDGNNEIGDGCLPTCELTYCGDAITQDPNGVGTGGTTNIGDEECDYGLPYGTGISCDNSCVWSGCAPENVEEWHVYITGYNFYTTDDSSVVGFSGDCHFVEINSGTTITSSVTENSKPVKKHYGFSSSMGTGAYIHEVRLYSSTNGMADIDLSACIYNGNDVPAYETCLENELESQITTVFGGQAGTNYEYELWGQGEYMIIQFTNKHNPSSQRIGINEDDPYIKQFRGSGTLTYYDANASGGYYQPHIKCEYVTSCGTLFATFDSVYDSLTNGLFLDSTYNYIDTSRMELGFDPNGSDINGHNTNNVHAVTCADAVAEDCAGVCGGSAVLDACGVCQGPGENTCVDYDGSVTSNACSTYTTCDACPGEPAEVCDGVDNNCDGQIDEGFDADSDGIADCVDNCPNIANAGQEDINGYDDVAGTAGDACEEYCGDGVIQTSLGEECERDVDGNGDPTGPSDGCHPVTCTLITPNNECEEVLDVVLLLDSSGSMANNFTTLQSASIDFLTELLEDSENQGGVVFYNSDVSAQSGLSSNLATLSNVINAETAGGGTNLYNALDDSITMINAGNASALKHIVIFTDGNISDLASSITLADSVGSTIDISMIQFGNGTDASDLVQGDGEYISIDDFDVLESVFTSLPSDLCGCGDGELDIGEECDVSLTGAVLYASGINFPPGYDPGCNGLCELVNAGPECSGPNFVPGAGECNYGYQTTLPQDWCEAGYDGSCDYCDVECQIQTVTGPICGDGHPDAGEEECDDGNTNNNDGCSDACILESPSCDIVTNTGSAMVGDIITYIISNVDISWTDLSNLDYGDGSQESSLSNAETKYNHIYTTGGIFTGVLTVTNGLDSSNVVDGITYPTATCEAAVEICTDNDGDGISSCDGDCNDNDKDVGVICCFLEVIPDLDFGEFTSTENVQKKTLEFKNLGYNISLHDYENSCKGSKVTIYAKEMVGDAYSDKIGPENKIYTWDATKTVNFAGADYYVPSQKVVEKDLKNVIDLFDGYDGSSTAYSQYGVEPVMDLNVPARQTADDYQGQYIVTLQD